jgi:hypothetical protein
METVKIIFISFIIFNTMAMFSQSIPGNSINSDSAKTAAAAFNLINTPEPQFNQHQVPNSGSTFRYQQEFSSTPYKFIMRDGKYLFAQKFACQSNVTIIILHGVLSSSLEMNRTSGSLYENRYPENYWA